MGSRKRQRRAGYATTAGRGAAADKVVLWLALTRGELKRWLGAATGARGVRALRGLLLGVPLGGFVGGPTAGLCGTLSAALTGTGPRGTFMLATGLDALVFGWPGGAAAGGVLGAVAAVVVLGAGRRVAAGTALGVVGSMAAGAVTAGDTWAVTVPVATLSGAVAGAAVGALFGGAISFREEGTGPPP